jgi:hypothetical protein
MREETQNGATQKWCDGKNAGRGRMARRNGATGRTLDVEQVQEAEETQKGAAQKWCDAGRGRYRMREARRNGAKGRTLDCGRYRNRKREETVEVEE